jgi:hypothetical protein
MRSFATFVSSIARGLCLRGAFTTFTVVFTVYFAFAMSTFVPFLAGCGGGGSTGGGAQQSTQTITFTQPTSPVPYASGLTIILSATGGGSGNPVIFTVDSTSTGKGTVSGNTLTVTAAGKLVVDANQAGNSNYYAASQVSVTVVVNPATSTVSVWPTANAITAGQALSASILIGGTASVPGVFAWTTPSTVPAAGTDLENATFTPTDNVDYTTVIGSVPVVVNPAVKTTPTINWPTPAAITAGTALSSTQLNATATANGSTIVGTFVYTPAAGTVPAVGTDALSVTFTPNDTTDYTTATATVSLVVNPAIPMLTSITPRSVIADNAVYFVPSYAEGMGFGNGDIVHDPTGLFPDFTLAGLSNGATEFEILTSWEEGTFMPIFDLTEIQHPGGPYGNQVATAFFGTGSQSTLAISPTTGTLIQDWETSGIYAQTAGGSPTLIFTGITGGPTSIAVDDQSGKVALTDSGIPGENNTTSLFVINEGGTQPCSIPLGMATVSGIAAKGGQIVFPDSIDNTIGIANTDCSGYHKLSAANQTSLPTAGQPWAVSMANNGTELDAHILYRDIASVNGLPLLVKINVVTGAVEGSVELTGFTPVSACRAINPYDCLFQVQAFSQSPYVAALFTSFATGGKVLIINTNTMKVVYSLSLPEIPFAIAAQDTATNPKLWVAYILANSAEAVTHITEIDPTTGNYNSNVGECPTGMLAGGFIATSNGVYCAQGGTITPPLVF